MQQLQIWFCYSFSEALERMDELETENRNIWRYYGEMISPMIKENSVPLTFLKEITRPLLAKNKAEILLNAVLQDASHREVREI